MQDRGYGPDSAARGAPQLHFLDKMVTCPLACNDMFWVQFLDQVGMPVTVQRQVRSLRGMSSTSPLWRTCRFPWFSTEIRQLQYIDKVIGVCRQSRSHSCSPFLLDQVVDMPVVFNDRCWVSKCRKLRRSRSCSTFDKVVDAPVGAAHRQVMDVL